jgi:DNA-binding response OmpR family regulator
MRVLVIDDDVHIRTGLRRLLVRKYGAQVAEAGNGIFGLQHLLDHPCDLILLDLHMRMMGGMETLAAIRRSPRYGSTPIMMLTGDSSEPVVAEARVLGVTDFLIKPVDATILFARIEGALTRAGRADLLIAEPLENGSAPAPPEKALQLRRVLADCVKQRRP